MTIANWFIAFLFTQVIEIPIYRWGFKISFSDAAIASLLTHPIVWFVIPHFFPLDNYVTFFLVAETFAIVAEAIWFFMRGYKKSLPASLLANGTSAILGLLKWWVISKMVS